MRNYPAQDALNVLTSIIGTYVKSFHESHGESEVTEQFLLQTFDNIRECYLYMCEQEK
jgi:hypothetical protein